MKGSDLPVLLVQDQEPLERKEVTLGNLIVSRREA
jgi:hypothetical protein